MLKLKEFNAPMTVLVYTRNGFNDCVPVVEIDGKIRFCGRVDPVLLRRLLAGCSND